MTPIRHPLLLLALVAPVLGAGATTQPAVIRAVATVAPAKSATTRPTNAHVSGTVVFTQDADAVAFTADLDGLEAHTRHGFHIHAKGDLSAADLTSAGGHYNPTGQPHGGPHSAHHHVGDLGNLTADANGHAHLTGKIPGLKVSDLVGRSVIVHADPDDLHSQPAGDSGPRIAGGVIQATKAQ